MLSKPIRLGVNIDHIATLRQARGESYPDPVHGAMLAEQAGADGITLHLREDRRHIQDRDVRLIKELLNVPINLEMAATEEMIKIAELVKPDHVCIVPEKREELTTEGGLDVVSKQVELTYAIQRLSAVGIEVSLFIDANAAQIEATKVCGAPTIELHTGHYASASDAIQQAEQYQKLIIAAELADELNLTVNAGHGLHYHNVSPIAAISLINELNIGHSMIAHAVWVGLPAAVKEMKQLMWQARLEAEKNSKAVTSKVQRPVHDKEDVIC